MSRFLNAFFVIAALLVISPIVTAQYGGGTTYPNCDTCASGTYISNNAPTYWNCCGSNVQCTYTNQGNVVSSCAAQTTISTTIATTLSTTVSPTAIAQNTANGTATTTAVTTQPTTTAPATYPNCSACASGAYLSNNAPTYWNCYVTGSLCNYTGAYGTTSSNASTGDTALIVYGLIAIIAIAAIALLVKMKALPTRLTVLGTALILIGTVAWLFGNYGGATQNILYGIVAIIIGLLVWLYGDIVGGTFKNSKAGILVIVGIILILVGTGVWYYIGSSNAIWGGVAAIVIGTIIWLYGDKIVGAFVMGKPKK
ncbi:MAG: hypothetical protein ACREBF_01995 [Candidatus Micrarchaeales archaeon]